MGEPASGPVDDGFFRTMAERYVEKTTDKAVDKRPRMGGVKGKGGLNPALLLAQPLAQAFDAYSTQKALGAGGREGNSFMEPFANNPAAMYATKVAGGALVALLADRLARSGHRNAAKLLSGISIGAPVVAGIHNMEMAGQSQ